MKRYTIFFITVNAIHVSGGFSAHHQELKNCTHSIGYMPSLLAATASYCCVRFFPTHYVTHINLHNAEPIYYIRQKFPDCAAHSPRGLHEKFTKAHVD